MTSSLHTHIGSILNQRVKHIHSLHGGMIGEVYRVELADGNSIVAKVAQSEGATLDIEGYMLRYLAKHSTLPVPEVLHSDPSLLLMTFVKGSSHLDGSSQAHAAELLADLHSVKAEQFGLERDTLIGPLHQPNPWSNSWIEFFREHRLMAMAEAADAERSLPAGMVDRIETLGSRLHNLIDEPQHPSLIHGDMWTTNVLTARGRVTCFVDPAIYYAHPEIELAYSTLFGTFGEAFFRRYRELRLIAPGFMEERRDIYNLYPLLVHVRLFGGSYVHSVDSILRKFGC